MLSKSAYDRLKFAVRQYESETRSLDIPQWDRMFRFTPIVTVRILSAIDPVTGLYDAIITESDSNTSWFDGIGQIKVKPSNTTDELEVGKRYPARPSYIDYATGTGELTGTGSYNEVYIAYGNCCDLGFVIGSGTGSYTNIGTYTGTVDWFDFEGDIITIHNTTVEITNSSTTYRNATNTYNNSSITFNTTSITYGPNSQVTFNTTQPAIINQNLALQLANNVNIIVRPQNPGQNNQFQFRIPAQFNNGLFMPHIVVPAIVANQNPLNLAGIVPNADAPIFRLKINAAGLNIQGIQPRPDDVPGKMFGIINAGPNKVQWPNRSATNPDYNVATPDGQSYNQSVGELLWFYADGSSTEWIMGAHSTGTASGITGLGTANYLPLWVDSDELTYSWARQDTSGSGAFIIERPSPDPMEAIKTKATKIYLGGVASPFVEIYASGAQVFSIQGQSGSFPKMELAHIGADTYLDITDGGAGNVAFSVRGTKGLTGTLRPGATSIGGIIQYLGTGEYGTGGGVTPGDKGDIEVLSVDEWRLKNDSVGTAEIANNAIVTDSIQDRAVTFPKIQAIDSQRVLGRTTASSGDIEQLSLGTGLEFGSLKLRASESTLFNLFFNSYPAFSPWGGRLSLSSSDPEGDSDSSTTIYMVPMWGDMITLWDGTRWKPYEFSTSNTLVLTGLTSGKNYDIWCRNVSGTPTLDHTVWTDDTTRATGITYFDGKYCKSGDQTRLYLGSFRSTSTTTVQDNTSNRFLWNTYNQRIRHMNVNYTGNWNYGTNAWRQHNGSNTNQVGFIIGLTSFLYFTSLIYAIGSVGVGGSTGINISITNAVHADCHWCENQSPANSLAYLISRQSPGYYYAAGLEIARSGSLNFYGQSASAVQGGLKGWILG